MADTDAVALHPGQRRAGLGQPLLGYLEHLADVAGPLPRLGVVAALDDTVADGDAHDRGLRRGVDHEHARTSSDVGCVLLTGNGPSEKNQKRSFCTGGDQRIRGRTGYQYADGETAETVDKAKLGRLHILECQRLIRFMPKVVVCVVPGWAAGGGHSLHVVADLTLASREHARFKQTDADVGSFDGGYGSR